VNALVRSAALATLFLLACKGADPSKAVQASPAASTFSVDPVTVVEKALDVAVSLHGQMASCAT